jgi:hypothetical protein
MHKDGALSSTLSAKVLHDNNLFVPIMTFDQFVDDV